MLICPEFRLPVGETTVIVPGRKKLQEKDGELGQVAPRGSCDFLLLHGPPELLGELVWKKKFVVSDIWNLLLRHPG